MSLPSDVQMSDTHPRRLSMSGIASRRRRGSTASRTSQARSPTVPRGFINTPKVHERPLHTLSTRELWDRLEFNAKILRDTACVRRRFRVPVLVTDSHPCGISSSSSQSAYVARMEAEQMQIQARLNEQGISTLNAQLGGVHITPADQAHNDSPQMIPAKRMALERFVRRIGLIINSPSLSHWSRCRNVHIQARDRYSSPKPKHRPSKPGRSNTRLPRTAAHGTVAH